MKSGKFSVYLNVGAYEIAGLREDNAEWRQGDSKGLWKDRESSSSTCSSSPYPARSGLQTSQTEVLLSPTGATGPGPAVTISRRCRRYSF